MTLCHPESHTETTQRGASFQICSCRETFFRFISINCNHGELSSTRFILSKFCLSKESRSAKTSQGCRKEVPGALLSSDLSTLLRFWQCCNNFYHHAKMQTKFYSCNTIQFWSLLKNIFTARPTRSKLCGEGRWELMLR